MSSNDVFRLLAEREAVDAKKKMKQIYTTRQIIDRLKKEERVLAEQYKHVRTKAEETGRVFYIRSSIFVGNKLNVATMNRENMEEVLRDLVGLQAKLKTVSKYSGTPYSGQRRRRRKRSNRSRCRK